MDTIEALELITEAVTALARVCNTLAERIEALEAELTAANARTDLLATPKRVGWTDLT
jgi:hypothetical protein